MFIYIYIYSYMKNFFPGKTITILRNFKQNIKIVRVIDVFLIFSIHLCFFTHTHTHTSIPFPPPTHTHTHTHKRREGEGINLKSRLDNLIYK